MTCTPEEAILLEEQEIKIANLICENHRLKGLLNDAGIPYGIEIKAEERMRSMDELIHGTISNVRSEERYFK